MKQVNSFRYWLLATLLICVGMTAKAYDLTVGTSEHGTVKFKVGSATTAVAAPTTANQGDKVTIVIEPAGKGWQVDKVTATAYTSWETAAARAMMPEELPTVKVIAVTGEKYTYEIASMPHNNVQIDVTYKKTSMNDVTIADIPDQTYTGSEIKPALTVKFGDVTLVENTDFTIVKWENNIDVSTADKPAKVTIKGIETAGFESTEKSKTFKIVAKSLRNQDITVDPIPDQEYTGSQITPDVVVKDGTKTLEKDKDYTVSYGENIKVGTASGKVKITGKGNYSDELNPTFNIIAVAPTVTKEPTAKTGLIYNGTDQTLVNDGTVEGGKIQYSTDNGSTWKDELPTGKDAGSYTIYWKVTGDENHSDTEKKKLDSQIAKAPLNELTLDKYEFNYDGTQKQPKETVKAKSKDKDGKDILITVPTSGYTISGNKQTNAGDKYKVVVTGKGNFEGNLEKGWKINKADISDETLYKIEMTPTTYVFNGEERKPTVTVTRLSDNKKLTQLTPEHPNADYKVEYANNINVGTATATVTGIDPNYQGSKKLTFTITKSDSKVEITPTKWETTFGVGDQSFKVQITKPSPAPSVQWLSGNMNVATVSTDGTVTATGAGVTTIYALVLGDDNYGMTWAACEVTVKPQEIKDVTTGAVDASGIPAIIAKNAAGETLVEGTDYEIEYTDLDENAKTADQMRQAPGKYLAVVTFIGNYQGIVKKEITVAASSPAADFGTLMSGLLDGSIPMGAVTDDTKKYDLNNDGKLDIVDIQMLMNLSIGLNADGSQKGSASRATAVTVEAPALLTVSCEEMGGVTRYALSLEDGRPFAAFQMDVVTTGSMQVVSEQAAFGDMSLFSGTLPSGTRRILGLSQGSVEHSGSVVYIDVMGEGSLSLENVCFSTPQYTSFSIRLAGDATSIDQLRSATADGEYFGIGGQRQNELKKGVNIVRQNGKTVKVIRK